MATVFSDYSATASAITFPDFTPRPARRKALRLYLHKPAAIFRALVNQSFFEYPLSEITYDTISSGAVEDIRPGMTVLFGSLPGADDLGRQRIRKPADATKIYFGRSSVGVHDGEIRPENNMHITVLDEYRVWAKIPLIEDDGTIYKDHDIAIEDNTINTPPVANTGPAVADTIDTVDGNIIVSLDASNSFATADGATITGYLWEIYDGTLVGGSLTSATAIVTFPAGFRYVHLTVTDSNAKTHTAHLPVYARDPADGSDTSVQSFEVTSHTITPQGQKISFKIPGPIPADEYPDGALVLFWEEGLVGSPEDKRLLFCGWHQTDPAQIQAQRTATLRDTVLECMDVAGRLDLLPWLPNELSNKETPTKWYEMYALTVDKYFHYSLHWHSTALEVADWQWSGTGSDYAFLRLQDFGESLYSQVQNLSSRIVPEYKFVCNRLGQMSIRVDPFFLDEVNRTETVQGTLDASDLSSLKYNQQRPPRYHWIYKGAILTDTRFLPDDNNVLYEIETVFSRAPGIKAPGQGLSKQEGYEGLTLSQDALNSVTGHLYARQNAPQSIFNITPSSGEDPFWEPADLTWLKLTLPAQYASQRNLNFTEARGLITEISIRYDANNRTIELQWERETSGPPGATYVPPTLSKKPNDNTWWTPGYWDDNAGNLIEEDVDPFYGNMKGYILWNGAYVMRTWNLLDPSPIWERIDTGITGNVQDGQYVFVTGAKVGMWLMTSTAIWWCNDVMVDAPIWEEVLPIATVRAADAVPESGLVVFKCMANYASEPGYLCVATGPLAPDSHNISYPHAYFWHTHNYGANWTQVDMNNYLIQSSLYTAPEGLRGYCYSNLYGMEIFRSEPGTIYCIRTIPVVALQSSHRVFISQDLGDTWTRTNYVMSSINNRQDMSLLHPFPSATDPSYVMQGDIGVSDRLDLHLSTDEWATGSKIVDNGVPSGYGGVSGLWRPNKRTFDTNHIMAWFRHSSSTHYHLLESVDRGESWSFLYNSGLGDIGIVNTPAGTFSASRHNTPNGWPPNIDEWVIVRASYGTIQAPVLAIQHTLDRFSTLQDKSGNLASILPSGLWTNGPANGFALPKVGRNR